MDENEFRLESLKRLAKGLGLPDEFIEGIDDLPKMSCYQEPLSPEDVEQLEGDVQEQFGDWINAHVPDGYTVDFGNGASDGRS